VLSVMGWAVEAVADYVENIRPEFGFADHPALWVTERGGRVKPPEINARFAAYRDALGLPRALTVHSERHAYVTHLTEDGADRRFIQQQVGHECDSSTAVYTHVSDDFMNTALSRALAPAFAGPGMFSGGHPVQRRSDPRVCAAQRLMYGTLATTTGVVQRSGRRVTGF
jgi:site-specific recombinase XerC